MKLPPYAEYRPCESAALERLPVTWQPKRLRFCALVNPRSARLRELAPEDEVSFVPMEAVGEYGGLTLDQTRAITEVGAGYTEFDDGDVVVAKITPCFENGKGALAEGLVNGAAFGTTELHVLRAGGDLDERFLFYLTISHYFRSAGEGEMYGAGGQKRVPPEFCKNILVPLPREAEQRTIADFLDRETAKIDALVAKKRTLIGRLQEKRTALISRTVTRGLPPDVARAAGLDPHPKLKPSGIDWLGDVPEHWPRPSKLRFLASTQKHSFVNGPFGSDLLASELVPDGVPVVYIRDVASGEYRRVSEVCVTPDKARELDFCRVDPGDVLIAKVGDPPGTAVVYPDAEPRGIVTQDVIRLRVDRSRVCASYLVYFLNSLAGRSLIDAIAVESTRVRVSLGDYKAAPCVLPGLPEQEAIALFLDCETKEIDLMMAKAEAAIERLREYRSALITTAVTGKIDVRRGTNGG